MSGETLLVVLGNSVYDIGMDQPTRCRDFDKDCLEIEKEGYTLRCWQYDPTRGRCPFVGD